MTAALSQYLESIRDNLRLDLVSENEIITELQTHIEDEVEEMRDCSSWSWWPATPKMG